MDAGLTARALSAAAGWHEAKTSRIESAKQSTSNEDIRTWCLVCHAESQAADLIAASRAAESMYMQWRRLHRSGMRRTQASRVPLYEGTKLFRVYCSTVVPGLFQTPGYAEALMSAITDFQGTPNDVTDAVAARMARNRVLYEGEHRFLALIEESVLRYQIGDVETMAAQLGHLLAMAGLPAVSLGVIPFTAPNRRMWTLEAFNIFDDNRVEVELLSAQVTVTAPGEIALYVNAFTELSRMAVRGAEARSLITSALDALQ
jgi:hypothetical protein